MPLKYIHVLGLLNSHFGYIDSASVSSSFFYPLWHSPGLCAGAVEPQCGTVTDGDATSV